MYLQKIGSKKYRNIILLVVVLLLLLSTSALASSIMNQSTHSHFGIPVTERDISYVVYVVSSNKAFDINLINSLKSMGFDVTNRSTLDLSNITMYDAVLISNDWFMENLGNGSIAELISTSTLTIFYGSYLNKTIYTYFSEHNIVKKMSVVPKVLAQNSSAKVLDTVFMYGFSFLSKINASVEDARYPCAHVFSFATDITDITLDILKTITDINSLKAIFMTRSLKPHLNNYHATDISVSGWDFVGYVSWLSYYAYVWGTKVGKMNLKVEYYHRRSDSHPGTWHWFLVHFIHESVPLNGLTAVTEAITQTDCDTDNKEGQILWSHMPLNGGGPAKAINFSLFIGELGATASVSYAEPTNGMYWSDRSDSGDGIHKVKYWFSKVYGQTWIVEPSGTYLKDGTKDHGELPLILTHYAKSTFMAYHGIYYATCGHTFGVLVYESSISSS